MSVRESLLENSSNGRRSESRSSDKAQEVGVLSENFRLVSMFKILGHFDCSRLKKDCLKIVEALCFMSSVVWRKKHYFQRNSDAKKALCKLPYPKRTMSGQTEEIDNLVLDANAVHVISAVRLSCSNFAFLYT